MIHSVRGIFNKHIQQQLLPIVLLAMNSCYTFPVESRANDAGTSQRGSLHLAPKPCKKHNSLKKNTQPPLPRFRAKGCFTSTEIYLTESGYTPEEQDKPSVSYPFVDRGDVLPLGVSVLPRDASHSSYQAIVPRRSTAVLPEALRRPLESKYAVLVLAWARGSRAKRIPK